MSILRFYGNKRENDVSVDYIRCEHDGCGGEAPPSERGEAVRCARTTGAELGFECSLDAAQLCGLKAELTKLIDSQKDSLRFYNLGNAFHSKVEHIGVRSGYQPDDVLTL